MRPLLIRIWVGFIIKPDLASRRDAKFLIIRDRDTCIEFMCLRSRVKRKTSASIRDCRVTLVVEYLDWVDFDLGCSAWAEGSYSSGPPAGGTPKI